MGHAPIKQSADVANTTKPTPPTIYKPIGKCIYCGSDGGNKPLSDEHIIPRSFAGGEILPRSSCAECAKVTSYLEGYCGRKLFWELRIADGFPTRRPKERPKALPVSFDLGDRIEKLNVPIKDHPSTVAFPLWPPPNILFNDSQTKIFGETRIASWTLRSRIAKLQKPEKTKSIKISISMDGRILARALAKIAHCHLVAERGLESFVPFLPTYHPWPEKTYTTFDR
jgi:hypothetical protein